MHPLLTRPRHSRVTPSQDPTRFVDFTMVTASSPDGPEVFYHFAQVLMEPSFFLDATDINFNLPSPFVGYHTDPR